MNGLNWGEKQDRPSVLVYRDMGSFHIWLARYLYSFRARQVLITNGQETLGVGLPWAIAACLVRPSEKVISVSGEPAPQRAELSDPSMRVVQFTF